MKNKIPTDLESLLKQKKDISLSEFINFCLYDIKNGYYQKKINLTKDFTTSPEICQIFGECIAIFFLYLLKEKNKHNNLEMIEFGPGNGTLADDILRIISKNKSINKIKLNLVEISNYLTKKQKIKLHKHIKTNLQVNWTKKINLGYRRQPIFFYCNEFFDSLPLDQFIKIDNKLYERRVKLDDHNKLIFINKKTQKKIPYNFSKIQNNKIIEYSANSEKMIKKTLNYITKKKGIFLIFDYGPFNKTNNNSLQSIYKKKKCNIFDFPCNADITHHVNFDYMKIIAKNYNLNIYGPISQSIFLEKFGAIERLNYLIKSNKNKNVNDLKLGLLRLIKSSEMGELFKCILFTSKDINLPKDFFRYEKKKFP